MASLRSPPPPPQPGMWVWSGPAAAMCGGLTCVACWPSTLSGRTITNSLGSLRPSVVAMGELLLADVCRQGDIVVVILELGEFHAATVGSNVRRLCPIFRARS